MSSVNPDEQSSDDDSESGTSVTTILACNSVSVFACLVTLMIYVTLSTRKKYKRIMRRRSLVLAACMASSDLVLHCSNLAGYGDLPPGFTCAFVGGWLFAAPSMLSIFYSCCIAFNSQIALVFKRRPPSGALGLLIVGPIVISFAITFSALGAQVYGFDETWGYCWYATEGVSASTVLIRLIFTYSLPTLLCMFYLLIATITISYAVFGTRVVITPRGSKLAMQPATETPFSSNTYPPSSPTSTWANFKPSLLKHGLSTPKEEARRDKKLFAFSRSSRTTAKPQARPLAAALPKRSNSSATQPKAPARTEAPPSTSSKKTVARRQLTVRLIGYIITPLLCLLPGIILDLDTKVNPDLSIPTSVNGVLDGLNGLIGLFNSILMLSDPALLAVWEDLRALVSRNTSNGSGGTLKRFVRRNTGSSVGEEETLSVGMGRRRRGRGSIGDDPLASGFGIGARTRIEDVEEGLALEERSAGGRARTGEENSRNPTRPVTPTYPDDRNEEGDDAQHGRGNEPPRISDVVGEGEGLDVREEGRHRGGGRRTEQSLEVHVRVDVTQETRRMSRIDLMEDWLSGL